MSGRHPMLIIANDKIADLQRDANMIHLAEESRGEQGDLIDKTLRFAVRANDMCRRALGTMRQIRTVLRRAAPSLQAGDAVQPEPEPKGQVL